MNDMAEGIMKAIELKAENERLTALLNDPVRLRKHIEQKMNDEIAAVQTTEQNDENCESEDSKEGS